MTRSKRHVDPALCLYVGAHVLCIIDIANLASKVPRGNRTLCHVVGIKLKDNAQSCRWKNYYNKKVNTVLASDVEWIELEHYPKSKEITSLEDEIKVVKQDTERRTISKQTRHSLNRKTVPTTRKFTQRTAETPFSFETTEFLCDSSSETSLHDS